MKVTINELKDLIYKIIKENQDSTRNKFEIVFLIGPPAVGKSTFVKNSKFKDYPILSHDEHVLKIARKYSDPNSRKYLYSDNIHTDKDENTGGAASKRRREATESFLAYRQEKIMAQVNSDHSDKGLVLDLTNTNSSMREKQRNEITAILLGKKPNEVTLQDKKNTITSTAIIFADKQNESTSELYSEDQQETIIRKNRERYMELDSLRQKEESEDEQRLANKEEIKSMSEREGDIKNVPEKFIKKLLTTVDLPIDGDGEFEKIHYVGIHPSAEKIRELKLDKK
jgi:hypothetical protein